MSGAILGAFAGAAGAASPPSNPVTLGQFTFQAYEVPEKIPFGGQQRLTVHKLQGGERVIDVMGRDEAEITWTGYISGPDAMIRARTLDTMRAAGDTLPLTWGGLYYSVVISNYQPVYKYGTWVPYTIACTVLRDEAAAAQQNQQSAEESTQDDLNSAANYTPPGDGSTTVSQETTGAPGVIKTQTFKPTADPFAAGTTDPAQLPRVNLAEDQQAITPVTQVGNAQVSVGTAADGGFQQQSGNYRVGLGDLTSAQGAAANASATSDAGLEAINAGAPPGGLVSGPTALQSATSTAGNAAGYNFSDSYLMRATNSMIGGT